jgi:nucleotide-binding universal stress UspA family protein
MAHTSTRVAHRIVVGIDGSPSSVAALEWAAHQAELTGGTIRAVAAWEWPVSQGWAIPYPDDWDPAADVRAALDGVLDTAKAAHPSVDFERKVVEGNPAVVLVEASTGADLLVVGSRGRGEFAGMLLGSVSDHCVHHATCPITVVH